MTADMILADQLTFAPPALISVVEVDVDEANRLLAQWGHYLGDWTRPFGRECYVLAAPEPVAVAISGSAISSTFTCAHGRTYQRGQVVELARLAAEPWATRVMLRLWREVLARHWPHAAPLLGAVAYSQNDRHEGRIYRFDGWERCLITAGSSGGGTWSTQRDASHVAAGHKTSWFWHYDEAAP